MPQRITVIVFLKKLIHSYGNLKKKVETVDKKFRDQIK